MSWRLRLLGGGRLEGNGVPARGRAAQRRRLAVLAILARAPVGGPGVRRDRIVGLLWPDSSPDAARRLLSESLYVIRKELGDDAIFATGDELALSERVLSDIAEFRRLIDAGRLVEAAESYGGPFLDAWYLPDAVEFERWVERERAILHDEYVGCLDRLAARVEAEGDWEAAVRWLRKLVSAEPYRTPVAMRLAEALLAAGQRAGAIQAMGDHTSRLHDDLDILPDEAMTAFIEELRRRTLRSTPPSVPRHDDKRDVELARAPSEPVPASRESRTPSRARRRIAIGAGLLVLVLGTLSVASLRRSAAPQGRLLPQFDPNDVAVRPFRDLSGRHAAIAYGLADELMLRLAGVAPLRVAARNAVMHADDASLGIDSVARALHVGTVIEGSLNEVNGQISVIAMVTDVATGKYVGAIEVRRPASDYVGLVEDLAASIERDFRRRLGENFRLRELTAGTRNVEAIRYMAEAQRAIDLARETGYEWRADAVVISRQYLSAADSLLHLASAADPRWPRPLIAAAAAASMRAASEPTASVFTVIDSGLAHLARAKYLDSTNASALELEGKLRTQRYLRYAGHDSSNRDLRLAIAAYEHAKSRDSLRVSAWIGRAYVAWFMLDTVAARRNLEVAGRIDTYLDGESDLLLNRFLVALWLRDWEAAKSACTAGRRGDPRSYLFLQCELTLARHASSLKPDATHAWALVDTLGRMHPMDKAVAAGRPYVPIYWRVLAATISARAGRVREAAAAFAAASADACRYRVMTDFAPDAAIYYWTVGDTAAAGATMESFLEERPQQRDNMRGDALLGPIIARTGAIRQAGAKRAMNSCVDSSRN